jgi:hypothetical protein
MSMATLNYIADALKFVAVPFAIFELFERDRRERYERAVIKVVKYNATLFPVLLICTLIGFLLLALGAAYLFPVFVTIWIVGGLVLRIFATKGDGTAIAIGVVFQLLVSLVFVAALIVWPMPDSWLVSMMAPSSWILDVVRGVVCWLHDGADAYVPKFAASQYIETYRSATAAFEGWIWGFLRWMIISYIWASDGLMFLALVLLELSLVVFFLSAIVSLFAIPAAGFVKLSEVLKWQFDSTDKGVLPLGGLMVWAIGESLNFAISTYKIF